MKRNDQFVWIVWGAMIVVTILEIIWNPNNNSGQRFTSTLSFQVDVDVVVGVGVGVNVATGSKDEDEVEVEGKIEGQRIKNASPLETLALPSRMTRKQPLTSPTPRIEHSTTITTTPPTTATTTTAKKVVAPTTKEELQVDPLEVLQRRGHRICRLSPNPVVGQDNVDPASTMHPALPMIFYQCAGSDYDTFVTNMWSRVVASRQRNNSTVSAKNRAQQQWGARPTPLPLLHTNTGATPRAVLFVGHSHTRQVFAEMVCQYQDQLLSRRSLMDFDNATDGGGKNVAEEYLFTNNITFYAIFNQPFWYSRKWLDILQIVILQGRSLSSMDALVLGPLHNWAGTQGTYFRKTTLAYQARHPEQEIDFEHIVAPTLQEFAALYTGPIVWVGPFDQRGSEQHKQAERELNRLSVLRLVAAAGADDKNNTSTSTSTSSSSNQTRRRNGAVRSVNSRRYINDKELLNGTECTSNSGKVGTCAVPPKHPNYHDFHRCTGVKGGEPDLVAWDVIEALHEVLLQQ